jgi:chromosome segregation ATPase
MSFQSPSVNGSQNHGTSYHYDEDDDIDVGRTAHQSYVPSYYPQQYQTPVLKEEPSVDVSYSGGMGPVELEPSFHDQSFQQGQLGQYQQPSPQINLAMQQRITPQQKNALPRPKSNNTSINSDIQPSKNLVTPLLQKKVQRMEKEVEGLEAQLQQERIKNQQLFREEMEKRLHELGIDENKTNLMIQLSDKTANIVRMRNDLETKEKYLVQADSDKKQAIARAEELAQADERSKQKIKRLEMEMSKYKTEKGSLGSNVDRLAQEKNTLQEYAEQTRKQKDALNFELQQVRAQTEHLRRENENQRKEIENSSSQVETLNKTVNSIRGELAAQKNETEVAKKRLESAQTQLQAKIAEWEELNGLQNELLTAISETKKQVRRLEGEKQNNSGEFAKIAKEHERLEIIVASLQSDLKQARSQLVEQRNNMTETMEAREREFAAESERLNSEIDELKAQGEHQDRAIASLQNTLQASQQQLDSLKDTSQHAIILDKQLKAQKEQTAKYQIEIEELQQQVHEMDELQVILEDTNQKVALLENQKSEVETNLRNTKERLTGLEKDYERANGEKLVERKVLHEEIHDLRTQRDALKKIMDEVTARKEELEHNYRHVSEELEDERHNSSETITELRSTVDSLQSELSDITAERSRIEVDLTMTQQTLQETSERLNEVTKEKVQLDSQFDHEKRSVVDLGARTQHQESEIEQKNGNISKLKSQLHEVMESSQSEKNKLQLEIQSLLEMLKFVKIECNQKKKKIQLLEKTRGTDPNAEHHRETITKLEQEKEKSQKEIDSCHEVIKLLRSTNKKMEDRFSQHQNVVVVLEKKFNEEKEAKKVLAEEVLRLRSKLKMNIEAKE